MNTPTQKSDKSEDSNQSNEESTVLVQVSQRGSPPETASKLVWWLARLAIRQMGRSAPPKIGDTVIEVTHLVGLARRQLGLLSAVGTLIKIEEDEQRSPLYTILTIEGKEQRWENAEIVTIDSPN